MKTELANISIDESMTIAKTFAESGMFTDAKQQAQAFVKIIAGKEIGIPPFAAMSGIHIIQGKPTLGAGLIASAIKGSGKYDYRVQKLDDNICSIDFLQKDEVIGTSTFTIEEAKKAGTKNIDKFPKNMLFARAISNGVKWFCPDVFSGPVYVPEEMPEQTEEITHVEVVEITPKPLTDAQMKRILTSDIVTVKKAFKAIEKGDVSATPEQIAQLKIYHETLLG